MLHDPRYVVAMEGRDLAFLHAEYIATGNIDYLASSGQWPLGCHQRAEMCATNGQLDDDGIRCDVQAEDFAMDVGKALSHVFRDFGDIRTAKIHLG